MSEENDAVISQRRGSNQDNSYWSTQNWESTDSQTGNRWQSHKPKKEPRVKAEVTEEDKRLKELVKFRAGLDLSTDEAERLKWCCEFSVQNFDMSRLSEAFANKTRNFMTYIGCEDRKDVGQGQRQVRCS